MIVSLPQNYFQTDKIVFVSAALQRTKTIAAIGTSVATLCADRLKMTLAVTVGPFCLLSPG